MEVEETSMQRLPYAEARPQMKPGDVIARLDDLVEVADAPMRAAVVSGPSLSND